MNIEKIPHIQIEPQYQQPFNQIHEALQPAQQALKQMERQPKKSLCNRFIKKIKEGFEKIKNYFIRCFKIDKPEEKQPEINFKGPKQVNPDAKLEEIVVPQEDVVVPLKLEPNMKKVLVEKPDEIVVPQELELNMKKAPVEKPNEIIVPQENPIKEISKEKPIYKAISPGQPQNASEQAYLQAINLMFEGKREIDWGVFRPLLTPEELIRQHEQLKIELNQISPEDLNSVTYYRDGMMTRDVTLLTQAIIGIEDPNRRLAIVKILLDKGADPRVPGFYYQERDPLMEARAIKDEQLIKLLEQALQKFNVPN